MNSTLEKSGGRKIKSQSKSSRSRQIKGTLYSIQSESDPAWLHHQKKFQPYFNYWVKEKKMPHAILLSGPEGSGKRSVIDLLVRWICCQHSAFQNQEEQLTGLFDDQPSSTSNQSEKSPHLFPCQNCYFCLKAENQNLVDFTVIEPEAPSTLTQSKRLKIDQLKSLQKSLGHGPMEAPYRLFLISHADLMTPQAANSILKILEEPPLNWLFFLTAENESAILPTIQSRCQTIRLGPYPDSVLLAMLQRKFPESKTLQTIVKAAQGNYTFASSLIQDQRLTDLKEVHHFLSHPKTQLGEMMDWCVQNPRNFELFLNEFERDCLEKIQRNPSNLKLYERFEQISEFRSLAQKPVNRKLLIQTALTSTFS